MLDFGFFDMSDFGHVPGELGVGIWAGRRNFDGIFSNEGHFRLVWVPTAAENVFCRPNFEVSAGFRAF